MRRIHSSPTLQVAAEAARLVEQGVDLVDLGAGEPDFPTPAHIVAAGQEALARGFTKYTTNVGTTELRRAIANRYRDDYGVEYAESEIIVSAGGKQALFNAILALFGPGDEVLTHAPGWPSIPEQIKLAEATPVAVRTRAEDGFALRAADFLDAITPRTRGIVVNSPCNPTGALIAEAEMATLARAAAERQLWIVVDLCYERLIYDPTPHALPKVLADLHRDRTVLCGSASKAYAMTGWRLGWAMGPAEVVKGCAAIQSHSTSNVCSITQKAGVEALTGPQACVTTMLDEYRWRRDRIWSLLTADPRIRCVKPGGAFYLLVDIGELLSPADLRTSSAFARALLDEARVAVTPGEAFDAPGCVRISYATSRERLEEAARRIHAFVAQLDARRRAAAPSEAGARS
jgi:aspartate aminotransferase